MIKQENNQQRDRKLEAVAFLRNHEAGNRERLVRIRHILNGEPEAPVKTQIPLPSDNPADNREQGFWRSLRRRCAMALLLTIFLCVGDMSGNKEAEKSIRIIKEVISKDNSENMFDFIQQITYTHEYEKINAKG